MSSSDSLIWQAKEQSTSMSSNQIKEISIEWTYAPADYFEAPLSIDGKGYSLIIDEGVVTAKVDPELYPDLDHLTNDIQTELRNMLLGIQVITHKTHSISSPKANISRIDGSKIINLSASIDAIVVTSDQVDIIIKDSNGNILTDSRQERIEKKREWARLAAKYIPTDPTVKFLFESYQAAVQDLDNELIHLYEIRDAIKKSLGNEKTVRRQLQLTNAQWEKTWKRLGDLANHEPLSQGRHRGENPGQLRDATLEELQEARAIAGELVYRYLITLERDSADKNSTKDAEEGKEQPTQ